MTIVLLSPNGNDDDNDYDGTDNDTIDKHTLSIDDIIGSSILAANKFKQVSTYVTIDSESKLYVNQGEIISHVHLSEFDVIGSDDATTCLIIIIKDQDGFLSVAHIDDSCIDSYISKIAMNDDDIDDRVVGNTSCKKYDLYILGSYVMDSMDPTHAQCVQLILQQFQRLPSTYKLKLFYVLTANTIIVNGINTPHQQGIAYVRSLDAVVPVHFLDAHRGPMIQQRMLYSMFVRHSSIIETYDITSKTFIVRICKQVPWSPNYISDLLMLSDDELLQQCSTSPFVERSRFVADLREVFSLMMDATTSNNNSNNGCHTGNLMRHKSVEESILFRCISGRWIQV